MPVLQVRNVSDQLHTHLQRRAVDQLRSFSDEVLTLLERAVEETERSSQAALDSIRRRRFFEPATAGPWPRPDTGKGWTGRRGLAPEIAWAEYEVLRKWQFLPVWRPGSARDQVSSFEITASA